MRDLSAPLRLDSRMRNDKNSPIMVSIFSEADNDAEIMAFGNVVGSFGFSDLAAGSSWGMLLARIESRSTWFPDISGP